MPDSRTPRRFATRQEDDEGDRETHLVRLERGHGGRQSEHARGDRDGDGEDVVDEERRRRDEARQPSEVVLGDDVGAAARLVGVHRLRVGEDDDRQHCCDHDGDRHDQAGRRRRGCDQHDEPRLGRVGHRRQRVGGEDRQGELLRDERVVHLAARARAADERPLPGDRAFGDVRGSRPWSVAFELGEDGRDALVSPHGIQAVVANRRRLGQDAAQAREARLREAVDRSLEADRRSARTGPTAPRPCRTRRRTPGGSALAQRARSAEPRERDAAARGRAHANVQSSTRIDRMPTSLSDPSGSRPEVSRSSQDGMTRR